MKIADRRSDRRHTVETNPLDTLHFRDLLREYEFGRLALVLWTVFSKELEYGADRLLPGSRIDEECRVTMQIIRHSHGLDDGGGLTNRDHRIFRVERLQVRGRQPGSHFFTARFVTFFSWQRFFTRLGSSAIS